MNRVLFILVVVLITSGNFGCKKTKELDNLQNQSIQSTTTFDSEKTNDKAPDFTLKLTDGKDIKLSNFKGKIIIVDFWATWCGPCKRGIPDLVEIQKEYKNKVVIIGVSLDNETKPDVVPFIKQYNINYPIAYGTMEVVKAYGNIEAIPTSFVIDQSGKIVDKHVGLVSKSVYVNKIKELLKKS